MVKSRYIVYKLIRKSDIILEIIDARLINETRNPSIENKIKGLNKKLILVVNKIDLINKVDIEELRKVAPVIMFSCKTNYGKNELIKTILNITKKRPLFIGVIGYPNTGKSSVINILRGKKVARTSPEAGFTKGIQWIRISRDIMLVDSPGVIKRREEFMDLVLTRAVSKIKDYELAAIELLEILIRKNPKTIEERYGIDIKRNAYATLLEIAKAKKKLKKGGKLDLDATARMIIQDWYKNKLNLG